MAGAQRFKQANLPRQPGELARFKVVQGPDFGAVYVVTAVKVKIGRGEDNDVVLSDLKASRHHAQLVLVQGAWAIRDSGSANGINFSGRFVRELSLKGGEVIAMGETTLEFLVSPNTGTQVLAAPVKELAVLKAEQAALVDKRREVRALGGFGGAGSAQPRQAGAKNKRTTLFAVAAIGAIAFLYLGNPNPPAPSAPKAPTEGGGKNGEGGTRDLASYLPQGDSAKEIDKSAESFFRAGFREFREHNYLRARTSFETVLQILPGHPLATLYLENCKKAIDDEVRFHLQSGKKCIEAGKLKDAQGHFEAVVRLLYKDPKNPSYAEAQEQLDKLKKTISEGGYG